MNKTQLTQYIAEAYGVSPDYPWESNPSFAVFRHTSNNKWFALIMDIPRSRLGLKGESIIDVVNLKCDPVMIGSLRTQEGFFPAYHMNKDKWISVSLDGNVDDEQLKMLLDLSYDATEEKLNRKKRK